jgi:hypothetical protein
MLVNWILHALVYIVLKRQESRGTSLRRHICLRKKKKETGDRKGNNNVEGRKEKDQQALHCSIKESSTHTHRKKK